jgi:cation:H+ antiporter
LGIGCRTVTAAVDGVIFLLAAGVALGTSWVMVSRLERVGERLGLSEAFLGLVAALAADAPEITSAATALIRHQPEVGAGVVLGSGPFNLAALLGLGAVLAGRITLHRRVIALGGAVAVAIAVAALVTVQVRVAPGAGLVFSLVILAGYIAVLGLGLKGRSVPVLPPVLASWLQAAAAEEEAEMEEGQLPEPGSIRDAVIVGVSLVVVVLASVAMERSAVSLGQRLSVSDIVIGALVLAGVTSLPNSVAAIYLVRRGRGAATFSTALNSNNLNIVAGLLIPATVLGLGPPSEAAVLVAAWCAGLTAFTVGLGYWRGGFTRATGLMIIAGYIGFAGSVVAFGQA